MLTFVSIFHALVALGLIAFVLLQDPKSGASGIFGGGTSTSLFGATGAANLLTTVTKWLAVIFAVSCLTLAYLTSKKGSSLMDTYTAPAATATPESSAPATPPPAEAEKAEASAPATPPATNETPAEKK